MQGLGFESDVPFARSLFSDSLALIYKRHEYSIFHSVVTTKSSSLTIPSSASMGTLDNFSSKSSESTMKSKLSSKEYNN